MDYTINISRYSFIFLIYILLSTGYISQILSCQMRHFLITSLYFKHIFGIIMVFSFIMFEGGWDFNKDEENKYNTNWASGNTIHTIIIAILMYLIFLISSKSQLIPNLIFFTLLFVLYFINTYRDYALKREHKFVVKYNKHILKFELIIGILAFLTLIYGFIDYYIYQYSMHPNNFSLKKFILGTSHCRSLLNLKNN